MNNDDCLPNMLVLGLSGARDGWVTLGTRQMLGPSWRDPLTCEHVGERFGPNSLPTSDERLEARLVYFYQYPLGYLISFRMKYFLYSSCPVVQLFTQFNSHQWPAELRNRLVTFLLSNKNSGWYIAETKHVQKHTVLETAKNYENKNSYIFNIFILFISFDIK